MSHLNEQLTTKLFKCKILPASFLNNQTKKTILSSHNNLLFFNKTFMPDSGTDPEGVDHKKLYDNVHAFTKDEIKCVMKYKCLKHLSCAVLYLYSQSIELGSIEQSIEY